MAGLRNATDTENLREVDSSAEQRWMIWKVARTIISEHPGMGVGVGAYTRAHGHTAMRPQFPAFAGGRRDTHSTYLNVAAETGLPGFVLFVTIIGVTARHAERARKRAVRHDPDGAYHVVVLQAGLAGYLVAGIWGSYAHLNILYIYLALLWSAAEAVGVGHPQVRTSRLNR
jgi:O-antigen ligase